MSDYKLVPVEQIKQAIYALERFANDTLTGRNAAHDLRELLSDASDVQVERVGCQYYQDGKWWNGDDRIKDHRKNTEEAGIPVRDVYADTKPLTEEKGLQPAKNPPPMPQVKPLKAEKQPTPNVSALVEAMETIQRATTYKNIQTGIEAAIALGFIAGICEGALAVWRQSNEGK